MVYVAVVTTGIRVLGVLAVFRNVCECELYANMMKSKIACKDICIKFYMRDFDKLYQGCDQPNNINNLTSCTEGSIFNSNKRSNDVHVVVTVHDSGQIMGVPAVFENIAKCRAYLNTSNELLTNGCVKFRSCLCNIGKMYENCVI